MGLFAALSTEITQLLSPPTTVLDFWPRFAMLITSPVITVISRWLALESIIEPIETRPRARVPLLILITSFVTTFSFDEPIDELTTDPIKTWLSALCPLAELTTFAEVLRDKTFPIAFVFDKEDLKIWLFAWFPIATLPLPCLRPLKRSFVDLNSH